MMVSNDCSSVSAAKADGAGIHAAAHTAAIAILNGLRPLALCFLMFKMPPRD
jgi:hypothetical protein